MQKLRRKKFGEILIAEGIISRDHLQQALEVQRQTGETLGEILLREAIISESDITRCICTQYGLPFLRLSSYKIERGLFEQFQSDFLFINRVLPIDKIGNCHLVCIGEIPDEAAEDHLRETLGEELYFYFVPAAELEQTLIQTYSLSQEQMLALNEQRRSRIRGDRGVPPISVPKPSTDAAADGTWESIFDEAEDNL